LHRLALTSAQIETLEQRTEGWITGLQMAAFSLKDRDSARFFESFTGDNRYIADYLIEEVLQRQPEALRQFLLKTSIFEQLTAPLCAAVTGAENSREYLDTLERANLFLVPLDHHREWYRYHTLFAELLRQRLRETSSAEQISRLHRAASSWYESQRDIPSTVHHLRLVPDELQAWRVLQRYVGTFFQSGALPQLAELASAVPAAQREKFPALCAAAAWATLASNHFNAVDGWLKAIERYFAMPAEAALSDTPLDVARRAGLLEVLVIRLHLPAYPPSVERVAAIRDQLNALPPDQPCLFNIIANLKPVIAFNQGLLAETSGDAAAAASAFEETLTLSRERGNRYLYQLGRAHLAGIQAALGQLIASRETCEQGLLENPDLGASPYLSLLHARLGALYYEWNDLPAAEEHFTTGLSLARLWNMWESSVPLTLGRARLKQRKARLKQGIADFNAALRLVDDLASQPIENLVLTIEAYKALLQAVSGNHHAPAAWLAARQTEGALDPSPANETALLDVARTLILLERPADAETILEKVSAISLAGGRMLTNLRAGVILAKALAIQGKMSNALALLLEILPLTAPESYISTFVDEGEIMRQLLQQVRSKLADRLAGSSADLRAYIERVLAAFTPRDQPSEQRPAVFGGMELSEREREILSLVAKGLSNQEIAHKLVISITTVKTHIGNIFNKLGVVNRIQAIARAEGLGLLPRH
jgi:LuxR family maltose regulon positive regulatory protein